MNTTMYSNVMLSVSYGCETCSRILGDERKLRVLENMVLKKVLGTRRKRQENGEDCTMRSFMICKPHKIYLGR
jgi:hypothetical protein